MRLELGDPVPADPRGRPVYDEFGLERCLIKCGVAECGEARGPSAHGLDESLLALDDVDHTSKLGLAGELQAAFRLAPYRVEGVATRQEVRDGVVASVAGNTQFAGFDTCAEC